MDEANEQSLSEIDNQEIIIEEPELLSAFYEFIEKYGKIPKESIYQAFQPINISSAKAKSKCCRAVINLLETQSRGANIQRIEYATEEASYDKEVQFSLHEAKVEIEISAEYLFEVQRAIQLLLQMFRHPRGIEHFSSHNISPLYAYKVIEESEYNTKKQAYSCRLICHCSYYSKLIIPIETFSSVDFITKYTDTLYG